MKKILVIDDEEKIRMLYSNLLEAEGFKVIEASNAYDGNEVLKREKVDLVLLDIRMPEVDGGIMFEAMQLFHKETKVLITSVYSLSEQRQVVNAAVNYHDKAEGNAVLLTKVREALKD